MNSLRLNTHEPSEHRQGLAYMKYSQARHLEVHFELLQGLIHRHRWKNTPSFLNCGIPAKTP